MAVGVFLQTSCLRLPHNGAPIMQTHSEPSQFGMQPLPMLENGQKLILAAASLQAHAFKTMMRYQIETLAFLKHRYEQDVKLAEDLVAGSEFNDAFDVFSNFLQNATSEYATEAGKVAALTSKLTSETARRVRKEAETAIEDMAAKTVA
ncbi:phasin family protein [Mesorhizobium qingshengii]|nr:phasin family protein [Mesorhizobium qingshengii]